MVVRRVPLPSCLPGFVTHRANFEHGSLSSDSDTTESLQPLRQARAGVSLLVGVAKLLVVSFVLSLVRSGRLIYSALSQSGIAKPSSSSCCHVGWALCPCLTSSGWGYPQIFGLHRDSRAIWHSISLGPPRHPSNAILGYPVFFYAMTVNDL